MAYAGSGSCTRGDKLLRRGSDWPQGEVPRSMLVHRDRAQLVWVFVSCACMRSVDNSEWTRNGDYAPTRFSAQNEAVGYLANAKLQENQESSVGLMTMAGSRIQVLISPGREPGQLLNSLAKDVKIGGQSNFVAALKVSARCYASTVARSPLVQRGSGPFSLCMLCMSRPPSSL